MTSTRLMFLFLAIASFAPVALGFRPGWWVAYYYGTLLVAWVLVSVAAVRRPAPDDGTAGLWDIESVVMTGTHADPASHAPAQKEFIIVARDQVDLYGRIRSRVLRGELEDRAVVIITDRRGTDRRRQSEVYVPDRRRAQRRRFDVEPLLRTRGWVELRPPGS